MVKMINIMLYAFYHNKKRERNKGIFSSTIEKAHRQRWLRLFHIDTQTCDSHLVTVTGRRLRNTANPLG